MDDSLQSAIDALRIRDVYLRQSDAFLADGFEPKYDPDVDALEVQFQHRVTESSVLEVEDDGEVLPRLFRVFIHLGARLVAPAESADGAQTLPDSERLSDKARVATDDPSRVCAMITGMMVAEYDMVGDPSKEALKEFALRNASFHVWPYWREFLASQCLRMNLPKVMLPAVQFAQPTESDPAPKQ